MMKRLENNVLYVDIEDLIYLELIAPMSEFEARKYYNTRNNEMHFESPKSIEFFMNNEEILDYNEVIKLSKEEINKKLIKIEERIFYYEHQFFNLTNKNLLEKEKERKRALRWLKHQKATLNRILTAKQYEIAKKLK